MYTQNHLPCFLNQLRVPRGEMLVGLLSMIHGFTNQLCNPALAWKFSSLRFPCLVGGEWAVFNGVIVLFSYRFLFLGIHHCQQFVPDSNLVTSVPEQFTSDKLTWIHLIIYDSPPQLCSTPRLSYQKQGFSNCSNA